MVALEHLGEAGAQGKSEPGTGWPEAATVAAAMARGMGVVTVEAVVVRSIPTLGMF